MKMPQLSRPIWIAIGVVVAIVAVWLIFGSPSSIDTSSTAPAQKAESVESTESDIGNITSELGLSGDAVQILRADNSKAVFQVEVARTPEEQEKGLMNRKELKHGTGMIFIWPAQQMVSMWMKNTLIPLDMIFVGDNGRIIKIAANTKPKDTTMISSDRYARAVIEVNGGEAEKNNVNLGDRVQFKGLWGK